MRVCVCVVRRVCVGAAWCMAVCREHVFNDSSLFYRFVDDEATPPDADCDDVDVRQCRDDLVDVVSYLCQIAPDAAMRMILRKPYDILAFFLDADTVGVGGPDFRKNLVVGSSIATTFIVQLQ